ncbi:unnamed protein product, partial [Rotaria sp. Silwood1]
MSRFTNLTPTVNAFEENELEDISESDEDDSQGGADDSEGGDDDSEGSDDDSQGGENDSELDDDDSKGEEVGNITTLLSSLVTNCPWTVNFSPPSAQEFQSSRKCYDILPSSSTQTFRRLFCDKVFNLILEQTNLYGREKCEKAGGMIDWTNITTAELEQFLGINIIMGYCRNPSIDSYWSTDASLRNEKISTSMSYASTGYVYNFEIYTGKSVERQGPLGEHVVWSMTRGLSMKFHHIYFDNFFTSPFLVERLLEQGIYCTGTLRTNRRGIPAEIIRDIKMDRGDVKFLAKTSISIVKWMDRKPIYIMSNCADPTNMTKVTRKLKNGQTIPLHCP